MSLCFNGPISYLRIKADVEALQMSENRHSEYNDATENTTFLIIMIRCYLHLNSLQKERIQKSN